MSIERDIKAAVYLLIFPHGGVDKLLPQCCILFIAVLKLFKFLPRFIYKFRVISSFLLKFDINSFQFAYRVLFIGLFIKPFMISHNKLSKLGPPVTYVIITNYIIS